MAHVNVGKMHTLERIGRWFVRPARMMLSRGSGQAPEKLSLIVAVVRVWSLRTPLEIVDSVRGGRVAAPGVSVSHGPSAYHRVRKSSKCIYSSLSCAFFLAAPFSLLPSFLSSLSSSFSSSTGSSFRTSSTLFPSPPSFRGILREEFSLRAKLRLSSLVGLVSRWSLLVCWTWKGGGRNARAGGSG